MSRLSMVPSVLKPIIIFVLIGIALIGGLKIMSDKGSSQNITSQDQNGGMTAHKIQAMTNNPYGEPVAMQVQPCSFYAEVLANVQELDKAIADFDDNGFLITNYQFIYDDYQRYDPAFGSIELDTQIKNFYINLIKIPGGYYSKTMLMETKAQGTDVLNRLSGRYGCKDYFEGSTDYAASASTTVVVGHAVSADTSAATTNLNDGVFE